MKHATMSNLINYYEMNKDYKVRTPRINLV
jgi:hypothetical protein